LVAVKTSLLGFISSNRPEAAGGQIVALELSADSESHSFRGKVHLRAFEDIESEDLATEKFKAVNSIRLLAGH
jgi:hypothetical protein